MQHIGGTSLKKDELVDENFFRRFCFVSCQKKIIEAFWKISSQVAWFFTGNSPKVQVFRIHGSSYESRFKKQEYICL